MPEPTRDPQAGTPGTPKLVQAYATFCHRIDLHEEFLDNRRRADDQLLEAILGEAGKEIFPNAPAVVLDRAAFVEIPAYQFTHGAVLLNGCMFTMFYFSDVQMGMLAVAMSIAGPTKSLRFSGKMLSPNLAASDDSRECGPWSGQMRRCRSTSVRLPS